MANFDKMINELLKQAENMKYSVKESDIYKEIDKFYQETKDEIKKEFQKDKDYECAKECFNNMNMPTNILDTNDARIYMIALPGYEKESFEIKIIDNKLIVSVCTLALEYVSNRNNFETKEWKQDFYKRVFELPENLSSDVSAKYENGILKIEIKRTKPKITKIKIN